jgi:hypothetical protein
MVSPEIYHNTCVNNFKIAKHEVTLELYQQYATENDGITIGDAGCYTKGIMWLEITVGKITSRFGITT